MQIKLINDAKVANLEIPAGEYWVSLQPEMGSIQLSGGGKDYRLPATHRRTVARGGESSQGGRGGRAREKPRSTTTIDFRSQGGALWSIVVNNARGEWIAMITYK